MAATNIKPKPPVKTNAVNHGGKMLALPVLSAPVGPESPGLKAKYPVMNQKADLDIVDYYLSALEAVKSLGPSQMSDIGAARLMGVASLVRADDRHASIRVLQAQLTEIRDPAEKLTGIIIPGGDTLKALVDLGDIAEKLLGSTEAPGPRQFIHMGSFNRPNLMEGYKKEFKKVAPGGLSQLVGMMERDVYVFDVRWMAYMLATAAKETGWRFQPIDEGGHGDLGKQKIKNEKGNPVLGKDGKPLYQDGKKDYFLPVKVKRVEGGKARIVEQDGDEFIVHADGRSYDRVGAARKGSRAAIPLTTTLIPATKAYQEAEGDEKRYYGRGYCQITWWNSYAAVGSIFGRNLDFLFNPELVKDPLIAYQIMSVGMRTGVMFANGRRLGQYIYGSHCDYVHARAMVNGTSHNVEIAGYARQFERILLAAKQTPLIA